MGRMRMYAYAYAIRRAAYATQNPYAMAYIGVNPTFNFDDFKAFSYLLSHHEAEKRRKTTRTSIFCMLPSGRQ